MPKRILLPLDRTPRVESVIPIAADLARGADATVRLLHVAASRAGAGSGVRRAFEDGEVARLANEALDYLRTMELYFDGIDVQSVVRFGAPLDETLREAESFEADLIVLAIADGRGSGRGRLGSVGDGVLDLAAAPVLLLRAGRGAARIP
jgi:nucleotide-binding universal stress UspA family protein